MASYSAGQPPGKDTRELLTEKRGVWMSTSHIQAINPGCWGRYLCCCWLQHLGYFHSCHLLSRLHDCCSSFLCPHMFWCCHCCCSCSWWCFCCLHNYFFWGFHCHHRCCSCSFRGFHCHHCCCPVPFRGVSCYHWCCSFPFLGFPCHCFHPCCCVPLGLSSKQSPKDSTGLILLEGGNGKSSNYPIIMRQTWIQVRCRVCVPATRHRASSYHCQAKEQESEIQSINLVSPLQFPNSRLLISRIIVPSGRRAEFSPAAPVTRAGSVFSASVGLSAFRDRGEEKEVTGSFLVQYPSKNKNSHQQQSIISAEHATETCPFPKVTPSADLLGRQSKGLSSQAGRSRWCIIFSPNFFNSETWQPLLFKSWSPHTALSVQSWIILFWENCYWIMPRTGLSLLVALHNFQPILKEFWKSNYYF